MTIKQAFSAEKSQDRQATSDLIHDYQVKVSSKAYDPKCG
jgi:hypothetical protein